MPHGMKMKYKKMMDDCNKRYMQNKKMVLKAMNELKKWQMKADKEYAGMMKNKKMMMKY